MATETLSLSQPFGNRSAVLCTLARQKAVKAIKRQLQARGIRLRVRRAAWVVRSSNLVLPCRGPQAPFQFLFQCFFLRHFAFLPPFDRSCAGQALNGPFKLGSEVMSSRLIAFVLPRLVLCGAFSSILRLTNSVLTRLASCRTRLTMLGGASNSARLRYHCERDKKCFHHDQPGSRGTSPRHSR
jgi:hypothetical protein